MTTCKFSELKPGDWFSVNATHGGIVRLICVISEGATPDGSHRGWCREVGVMCFSHDSEVTPLPDCTGWDWEPEPEIWYRKEYALPKEKNGVMWTQWISDRPGNCNTQRDDYIGYTIRRVWPDGRVEQEFVPKEKS